MSFRSATFLVCAVLFLWDKDIYQEQTSRNIRNMKQNLINGIKFKLSYIWKKVARPDFFSALDLLLFWCTAWKIKLIILPVDSIALEILEILYVCVDVKKKKEKRIVVQDALVFSINT